MRNSLRSWLVAVAVSLALAGMSSVATADNTRRKSGKTVSLKKASGDCAQARKRGKACKIEFKTGDTLEGGVATGSGENITAPIAVTHSSLIRLRTSFRDMIIRTGEQL